MICRIVQVAHMTYVPFWSLIYFWSVFCRRIKHSQKRPRPPRYFFILGGLIQTDLPLQTSNTTHHIGQTWNRQYSENTWSTQISAFKFPQSQKFSYLNSQIWHLKWKPDFHSRIIHFSHQNRSSPPAPTYSAAGVQPPSSRLAAAIMPLLLLCY